MKVGKKIKKDYEVRKRQRGKQKKGWLLLEKIVSVGEEALKKANLFLLEVKEWKKKSNAYKAHRVEREAEQMANQMDRLFPNIAKK